MNPLILTSATLMAIVEQHLSCSVSLIFGLASTALRVYRRHGF